jgi:large subunit ribosomal protein L21
MYAIVRTGAKQYRVERGQSLLVERLPVEEGASVQLEPLLYRSEETVTDRAALERVRVTAKVLEHVRGEKLRVFKFKPKRGYKRRTGHRQALTRIEVTEIAAGAAKAAGPVAETATQAPQAPKARKAAAGGRGAKAAKAPAGAKPAKAPAAKRAKAPGASKGASRGSKAGGDAKRGRSPATDGGSDGS